MAEKSEREQQPAKDRDERVAIPLDPEEALRGLLAVNPADGEADQDPDEPKAGLKNL